MVNRGQAACGAAAVMVCLMNLTAQGSVVGYWPLDGDGTAAVGVNAVPSAVAPFPTVDRNGAFGGALAFDGLFEQFLEVPGGGGLDGAIRGTVSMWVNWQGAGQDPDCCGTFGAVLARQSNAVFSDNVIALSTADPNTGAITWRQNSAGPALLNSGSAALSETWNHIAVRFSPGQSQMFINGVSVATAFVSPPMHSNPAIPLHIGAWGGDGGGFSTSIIDDVAVFDDYLSDAQILSLANQSATPLTVGSGTNGPDGPIAVAQAIASTEFPGRPAVATINSSGLLGDGGHVNNPPSTMWLTQSGDPMPFIAYDLGAVYSLDNLRIWNYNENANAVCCLGRGIAVANVEVAGADGVFTPALSGQVLQQAPGTNTDFSEVFGLGGVEARYVKITSVANHGDPSFTGLSEVQFRGEFASDGVDPLEVPAMIHSVTSELVGTFNRRAAHIVSGAGKFAEFHSVVPDGTMWLSNGSFAAPNDLAPEIVFDLGEMTQLSHMKFWNYNETLPGRPELLGRGVRFADILVAGEDLDFSVLIANHEFAIAPGLAMVDFGELIDLLGVSARYIKLDIHGNWGGDNNFVGISEVKFFRVVPEPATLLLAAACPLLWRRARKRAT